MEGRRERERERATVNFSDGDGLLRQRWRFPAVFIRVWTMEKNKGVNWWWILRGNREDELEDEVGVEDFERTQRR